MITGFFLADGWQAVTQASLLPWWQLEPSFLFDKRAACVNRTEWSWWRERERNRWIREGHRAVSISLLSGIFPAHNVHNVHTNTYMNTHTMQNMRVSESARWMWEEVSDEIPVNEEVTMQCHQPLSKPHKQTEAERERGRWSDDIEG